MNILSLDGGQWASLLRLTDNLGPASRPGLVKATVTGFSGGKVLLDVGGKPVLAESRVPLKLGQELQLSIVGDKDGKVFLRPVGSPASAAAEASQAVGKLLEALELPETPQSKQGALMLLQKGFTLTKPALEQAMRYLKAGGDPAAFFQAFQDQALFESLPPGLMSTLGSLWKKDEKETGAKQGASPSFAEVADPESLPEQLTSTLRAKAPVLLSGRKPEDLAALLEKGQPRELMDFLEKLPPSLLKERLAAGLTQEQAHRLAESLKTPATVPEMASQSRMALEQLQSLPVALALASQDPTEPHPILVEVNAPKDAQEETEIVLSLALSGLGELEVRLRSAGSGAPVKALFRAKDAASVRAISADLESLKQDASAHGVTLKPAASRLPQAEVKTSLDWQI